MHNENQSMMSAAQSFAWPNAWVRNFISSNNDLIIFGDGHQAVIVEHYCRFFNKNLRAAIVSQRPENKAWIQGSASQGLSVPVFSLAEAKRIAGLQTCDLLIAVHERHNDAIVKSLAELNLANIFLSPNWTEDNAAIRSFWFDWYFLEKNCYFKYISTPPIARKRECSVSMGRPHGASRFQLRTAASRNL